MRCAGAEAVPRAVASEVTARARFIDLDELSDEQKLALAVDLFDEVSGKMEERLAWRADVARLVAVFERC